MFDPQRVGRSLRAIRIRLGLRQTDVARRAGVSRAFVSKLERGLIRTSDMSRVERVCVALGAELDVRVRWRGEGLDRLLDEGHAELVDRVVAMLQAARCWHAGDRAVLIVEVKSVIADAQGILAPLDRKVRLAPKLARDRGLAPSLISRLLVVADTTTNRRRVGRFGELFGAALPIRGREVRQWLRRPQSSIAALVFLPDATPGSPRRTTAGRTRVNQARRRVRPTG